MKREGEQVLLRVLLRNTDKRGWFAAPAAEVLVRRAREAGLAGALVLRGIFGLDVTGKVLGERSAWALLVDDVPVIVEVVDSAAAIGNFLAVVEEEVAVGLATLERAHVMIYRHDGSARGRLELPPPIPPLSTLPSPEEFPAMKQSEEGQLLRIFIGESDTWQGAPLYKAIVLEAKKLGLAGATVLRGPMGFGAHSRVHTTKLAELSSDLPVVVEIVECTAQIEKLLPFLDEAVGEGLITLEVVRVLRYGPALS